MTGIDWLATFAVVIALWAWGRRINSKATWASPGWSLQPETGLAGGAIMAAKMRHGMRLDEDRMAVLEASRAVVGVRIVALVNHHPRLAYFLALVLYPLSRPALFCVDLLAVLRVLLLQPVILLTKLDNFILKIQNHLLKGEYLRLKRERDV